MWRILVDNREINSDVPRLLTNMGVNIQYKQLEVGDYILSSSVAIERKSIHDFITSLYDGRLFKQARSIEEMYSRPLLLIEGDISMVATLVSNLKVYYGTLASLTADSAIRTIFVPSAEHTALFIERMLRNINVSGTQQGPAMYKHIKGTDKALQQVYFLASLPGIGRKLAEKLLHKFGSPHNVLTASPKQLSDAIGPKRASNVHRFLSLEYTKALSEAESQSQLDDEL